MNLHGASAVHQAHRLAMLAGKTHPSQERSIQQSPDDEADSPTLAGYLLYVVAALGFIVMCLWAAFH